jgi:hypothetical protein
MHRIVDPMQSSPVDKDIILTTYLLKVEDCVVVCVWVVWCVSHNLCVCVWCVCVCVVTRFKLWLLLGKNRGRHKRRRPLQYRIDQGDSRYCCCCCYSHVFIDTWLIYSCCYCVLNLLKNLVDSWLSVAKVVVAVVEC